MDRINYFKDNKSLVDYFGKTLWRNDVIPGFNQDFWNTQKIYCQKIKLVNQKSKHMKMRNRIIPLIIKIMELMMKINNEAIKVNRN